MVAGTRSGVSHVQYSPSQDVLRKSFSEEITHLYFSSTKAILCVRSFLIELHIDYQITEMSLMAKCENEMRSLADLILVTGGNVTSSTN